MAHGSTPKIKGWRHVTHEISRVATRFFPDCTEIAVLSCCDYNLWKHLVDGKRLVGWLAGLVKAKAESELMRNPRIII